MIFSWFPPAPNSLLTHIVPTSPLQNNTVSYRNNPKYFSSADIVPLLLTFFLPISHLMCSSLTVLDHFISFPLCQYASLLLYLLHNVCKALWNGMTVLQEKTVQCCGPEYCKQSLEILLEDLFYSSICPSLSVPSQAQHPAHQKIPWVLLGHDVEVSCWSWGTGSASHVNSWGQQVGEKGWGASPMDTQRMGHERARGLLPTSSKTKKKRF